jgi:hypothetical protein
VGRGHSVKRPLRRSGRYIFATLNKDMPKLEAKLTGLLEEMAEGAINGE